MEKQIRFWPNLEIRSVGDGSLSDSRDQSSGFFELVNLENVLHHVSMWAIFIFYFTGNANYK